MAQRQHQMRDKAEWFFFSGGPGAPRYGDDPTKHAVDHDTEAFVREVLQNANDQGLDNSDPVEVTFRFVTLSGKEKESFIQSLGWNDGLGTRISSVARSERGRRYEEVLERIDNPEAELRLLVVEDRNTTGLSGEWDEDSNYAALVRDELYSSKQDDTAGGSYGLGKSVLWTFSGASTVIFNSYLNHGPRADDSPRVIGRSKLPTHKISGDNTTYQGAGWLCRPSETEDGVRPESVWGAEASEFADNLHIDRPSESGTSAMVVEYRDPTRDERPDLDELAQEFVEASVKYFWPAIERGDLEVTVETEEETIEAAVDSIPAIRPFVECYTSRFSEGASLENPGDVAGLDIPVELPSRADNMETPNGSVRLSARLASPADDDTYLNSVALFRGAGMVVKYYDQSRVAYGDRNFYGVLAAGEARPDGPVTEEDQEIDRFLRFSEPPEHDEWESTENLREQYKQGFRTTLDDMFGTMRDGLRHLLSKNVGSETLSDNVLNRFPIHGTGSPRSTTTQPEPAFDIQSTSGFDADHWFFSGQIEVTLEEFKEWTAEVSLTQVGEDGSKLKEIPVEEVDVSDDRINVQYDNKAALLRTDADVQELRFEGKSAQTGDGDTLDGEVGETQLEIRAELKTKEGDK